MELRPEIAEEPPGAHRFLMASRSNVAIRTASVLLSASATKHDSEFYRQPCRPCDDRIAAASFLDIGGEYIP